LPIADALHQRLAAFGMVAAIRVKSPFSQRA
jgi:hypothetical protein